MVRPKGNSIEGGTSEVQLNVIAKRVGLTDGLIARPEQPEKTPWLLC